MDPYAIFLLVWLKVRQLCCCTSRLERALRSAASKRVVRREASDPAVVSKLKSKDIAAALHNRDDEALSDAAVAAALLAAAGADPRDSGFEAVLLKPLTATVTGLRSSGHCQQLVDQLCAVDAGPLVQLRRQLYRCVLVSEPPRTPEFPQGEQGTHWPKLGFQGKNPATDFRGLGLFGLQQLCYFSGTRVLTARSIVAQCELPKTGFQLALTSLAMSSFTLALLKEGRLDYLWVQQQLGDKSSSSSHSDAESVEAIGYEGSSPDKALGKELVMALRSSAPAVTAEPTWRLLHPLFKVHSDLLVLFGHAWQAGTAGGGAPLLHGSGTTSLPAGAHATSLLAFPAIYVAFRACVEAALDANTPALPTEAAVKAAVAAKPAR